MQAILDQIIDAARFVPGALVAGFGLRLFLTATREMRRLAEGEPETPPRAASAPVSPPTRMVLALCCLLVGYHLVAYAARGTWPGICIPRDRWYVLALGVVAAVGISRLTDTIEWRSRDGGQSSRKGHNPAAGESTRPQGPYES